MGCGKFPCLIIKAFYGLLQSPGKEGQNREVGEASGWKSDLQSSWGSVAVVSLQKQNSDRPFQESWRLWNWKLRCNSWSDLHGTGLLCPRLRTNHSSSTMEHSGGWLRPSESLLWWHLLRCIMVTKKTGMVSSDHRAACPPAAEQQNEAAYLSCGPGWNTKHQRGEKKALFFTVHMGEAEAAKHLQSL